MADKIGAFLLRIASMTQRQIGEVLQAQKDGDKRLFGAIALEKGFIEDNSLKRFIDYLATHSEEGHLRIKDERNEKPN